MRVVALLLATLPLLASAGEISLQCNSAWGEISLRGNPDKQLTLIDKGFRRQWKAPAAYVDEAMIQMEVGSGSLKLAYTFANLTACADSISKTTKALLIVQEKLAVLRPISSHDCTCEFID